ncbi:MAG: DNA-binding protein [Actinobacteria bacterium]|nr:DNA-binding protein [Actinomycetota bacterium]
MAMNLRLSSEQTEALRKAAEQDGISMQEAALAAVDVYISRRGLRLQDAIAKVAAEDAELLERLSK